MCKKKAGVSVTIEVDDVKCVVSYSKAIATLEDLHPLIIQAVRGIGYHENTIEEWFGMGA